MTSYSDWCSKYNGLLLLRRRSTTLIRTSRRFPCELGLHILRSHPYDSNGTSAAVVDIGLNIVDEINRVTIEAGLLTISRIQYVRLLPNPTCTLRLGYSLCVYIVLQKYLMEATTICHACTQPR